MRIHYSALGIFHGITKLTPFTWSVRIVEPPTLMMQYSVNLWVLTGPYGTIPYFASLVIHRC